MVEVPAGALRLAFGNPLPLQQLATLLPRVELPVLAFRRAIRAGQAFEPDRLLLAVPVRSIRELCRSGGANGVQRWCRHGHWEAGE